jgi:hypothetical protein
MGYYIDGSSNYYEGDKRSPSDTAVDQRPYPTMDWTAGAWVYDLAATRIMAKQVYTVAMTADLSSAIATGTNPVDMLTTIGYAFMRADLVAYADNAANNCPFIDGYRAITGDTKANCVTDILNDADLAAGLLGKVLARRATDYNLIDAAATGPDIIAIVYVRPF